VNALNSNTSGIDHYLIEQPAESEDSKESGQLFQTEDSKESGQLFQTEDSKESGQLFQTEDSKELGQLFQTEDSEESDQLFQTAEPVFSNPKPALLKMLIQKRESKNLSFQNVEQRLKFKAKWVELLEAGDWSHLPKGASLRGFVKNYAKLIDVDASILYNAMAIDLDVDRHSIGRHTSIRALGDPVKTNSLNVKPVFSVVAGLIVVVILIVLMINGGVFGAGQWFDSLKRLTQ